MTEPSCTRMQLLVQADLDGELGVAEAAELAAHLDACAACRAVQHELAALSRRMRGEATRYAAPAALRASLQRQAAVPIPPRRWRLPRAAPGAGARLGAGAWLGAGAGLAIAASVALMLVPGAGGGVDAAAVAGHIRALQPGHLTDVVSTDQHTVKPWFDGRLDYAPPVRDFAAAGYPLAGGRLDYLSGRAVAALVYRRDRHLIDLFVWPASAVAADRRTVEGYNVESWSQEGMRFVAVSDLNGEELAAFAALWRRKTP